jgi:drug/metabolite transporter (DMT)-like permease
MNNPSISKKTAILALVVLVMIWGYNWVVVKVAVQYSSPFDFAALRILLGIAGLLPVVSRLHKLRLPRERILGTCLTGLLQTGGFYTFSTWALVSGGVGKTAVINYAMPFWVLLLAWMWLGDRVGRNEWVGIAFAMSGLFFVLMPFRFTEGLFSEVLALMSGLSWAVGIVVAKRLQRKAEIDLLPFTLWQMIFGSIPLILMALLTPSPPIRWTLPFLVSLGYSGFLGGAIAWSLWFYALSRLSAGAASLGTLATPVVGVLAASVQFREIPTSSEVIGMGLILCALLLNAVQALKLRDM